MAIAYVKDMGMVKGYEDGTFRPEATINQVELLKIVLAAIGHKSELSCGGASRI